jgi:hypothetical protein
MRVRPLAMMLVLVVVALAFGVAVVCVRVRVSPLSVTLLCALNDLARVRRTVLL